MSIADKLQTIAENVPKVYEAGKQAEYDAFWDEAQKNGTRTDYNFAFSADMWTKENFKPKYPIRPTIAYNTFAYMGQYLTSLSATRRLDFRDLCVLDVSLCTESQNMFFANKQVVALGVMDFRSMNEVNRVFNAAENLEIVEKIILKDDGAQSFTSVFYNCKSLATIAIEGIIGKSFDIGWSPLTKDSISSVINALSTAASGQTATFSKTAVNNAFTGGSTGSEWQTLIATKPNWTISLV